MDKPRCTISLRRLAAVDIPEIPLVLELLSTAA
jgi:hypothetical protein